jgi:hypothetical protein
MITQGDPAIFPDSRTLHLEGFEISDDTVIRLAENVSACTLPIRSGVNIKKIKLSRCGGPESLSVLKARLHAGIALWKLESWSEDKKTGVVNYEITHL